MSNQHENCIQLAKQTFTAGLFIIFVATFDAKQLYDPGKTEAVRLLREIDTVPGIIKSGKYPLKTK